MAKADKDLIQALNKNREAAEEILKWHKEHATLQVGDELPKDFADDLNELKENGLQASEIDDVYVDEEEEDEE